MRRYAGFHGRAGFGERPALVVVDLNVAFTDPASPLACDLDGVVGAVAHLLDEARRAGVPVVYTTVAYDEGARLAELYELGAPIDERDDGPDGVFVRARLPRREIPRFAPYLVDEAREEPHTATR